MSIELGTEAEGLRSRIDANETLTAAEYKKLAGIYITRRAWVDDGGWLLARANAFCAELYKGTQPDMNQDRFNLKMHDYFQPVAGTGHLPVGAVERVQQVVEGYLRVQVEEYRAGAVAQKMPQ